MAVVVRKAFVAWVLVAHIAVTAPLLFAWSGGLVAIELVVVAVAASSFLLGRYTRAGEDALVLTAELPPSDAMATPPLGFTPVTGLRPRRLPTESSVPMRCSASGRWSGQVVGPWRLGARIGRGAMGEIYEAFRPQPASSRAVLAGQAQSPSSATSRSPETGNVFPVSEGMTGAVKLLTAGAAEDPSFVERFRREMQISAQLRSPHIARVLDVAPTADVPYFAMERLVGTDLSAMLRARGRLPLLEVLNMLDQVSRGLEVARLAGVVHRDLKPQNLFFHAHATWKILDFGVARLAGPSGELTGSAVVGTPQYMAPEQAAGRAITHQADVYALGAIAYRCLTGRAPFTGTDVAAMVYQVVNEPPVRPSALGRVAASVEDVLAVAMAKDPAQRFASARELAQHLMAARDGRATQLHVPGDAWASA